MLLTLCLKEKKEWLFPDRLRSFLIRRVKINIPSTLHPPPCPTLCLPSISLAGKRENLCVRLRVMGKQSQRVFSLPVYKKCEFGEKEKSLVNQKGGCPQKRESPKQGEPCLSKQYPRKVLTGGLSILEIWSVFSYCPRYFN